MRNGITINGVNYESVDAKERYGRCKGCAFEKDIPCPHTCRSGDAACNLFGTNTIFVRLKNQ